MAKLKVSVNKNPTKEGIKVQFVLPETLEGDAKTEATQKLQSKLNQGLSQYNLTISQDTDTPYANVIGFLIPIADVKLLIKKALGMGEEGQAEPAPEATPAPEAAPEEPMKEIKRMMELAGLINEAEKDIEIDIDSAEQITLNGEELDSDKLGTNKKYRDIILKAPDKAFMYKGKPATITAVDLNDGSEDEPKIYLTIFTDK
jgi:biopolymer transport protein ExbD